MSPNTKLFLYIFIGLLIGATVVILGIRWIMDGVWYSSL